MALSASFRRALELHKFERKYGTLRNNRNRLLRLLQNAMLRNCRRALPELGWHTLWRLADGSLTFVIIAGEKHLLTGPRPDAPFMAESCDLTVLEAAAAGRGGIAPVSARLVTESDPELVARFAGLNPRPSRVLRELLRIYRLHLRGRLLFGYLQEERDVAVSELHTFLGKPGVEVRGSRRRPRPGAGSSGRHRIWLS